MDTSHSIQSCQQRSFDEIKNVERNVVRFIQRYKRTTNDDISSDLEELFNNIIEEVDILPSNVEELYNGRQRLRVYIDEIVDCNNEVYDLTDEVKTLENKVVELENTIEKLYQKFNSKALPIDLYLELQTLW